MLTRTEIIEVLQKANVLMEGHFLLTSGKHSDKYLQCARIFQNPEYAVLLCGELAEGFKDSGAQVVIGPAVGAVQMAYELARQMGLPNYFTERVDGKMELRRGFTIEPGMKCLLVEDVATTGGTVLEVKSLVEEKGGIVTGIGVIVDRSGGNINFGTDFRSVIKIDAQTYEADNCPLCKSGEIELIKPGSRAVK